VVVAGKRCPVAGRISMDLMAIDVTDLPNNAARRGQMVTLIGEGITVDELAHHFGTIGYEVLSSLGPRYARIYKGGVTPEVTPSPSVEAEPETKTNTTTPEGIGPTG
jgi:alanine racemase